MSLLENREIKHFTSSLTRTITKTEIPQGECVLLRTAPVRNNKYTHLLSKSGRVDAVELSEAVSQHAKPHGALHHVDALQLEVVHRVKACYAAGAGLGQSQELLGCRGDGLARRVEPEGRECEGDNETKRRARTDSAEWSDAKTYSV